MLDELRAGDLLHDHRPGPVPHREGAGLAGLQRQCLEDGLRQAAHVKLGQERPGKADNAEAQSVPPAFRVPLHVSRLGQTRQDPRNGALVQVDPLRDLGDSERWGANAERLQDPESVEQRSRRPLGRVVPVFRC